MCGAQCSADTFIDDAHCVVSIADGLIDYKKLLGPKRFAKIFGCQADELDSLLKDASTDSADLQQTFSSWGKYFLTTNPKLNKLRQDALKDYFGEKIFAQHAVVEYADGIMDLILRILHNVGFVLNSKTAGPSRVFRQLGWISDVEQQSLLPKEERLEKFFNLLEKVFTEELICVDDVRSIMGMANSFHNDESHFNHLKSCLALFLSIIAKTKSINSVTLSDEQAKEKHILPEFLWQGLLFFIQELQSLTYSVAKENSNFLVLQHTNPSVHYTSNAQFKEFFTQIQDASTYSIGAFATYKNQASSVVTIPLGKHFQDGTNEFRRFRTASTHRELMGILQTIKHFQETIKEQAPPGIKIVSDSKAALWNLFKSKGKNADTLNVVRQIRELLDSFNLPLVFEWRRRSDPFLRCADLASKNLFWASSWIHPDFEKRVFETFQISKFAVVKNFDEKFFQFSESRAIKEMLESQSDCPLILAPLNAARADSVINSVLREQKECLLVCPLIYHSHFITNLRSNYNYFITNYKNLFPNCTYNGFSALVCHVKY
jgi:hypothetical protein